MKTETTNGIPDGTEPPLQASTIFELLLDSRRRSLLYHLSRTLGPASLEDLTEDIASREAADVDAETVRIDLQHKHLPKLTDARVVEYDPNTETVELLPAARRLQPYLELTALEE